MTGTIESDYLVVGAGATGMAFTDTLIRHADVHVTLVDRRHGVGGHWLEAYPFVRLHQASAFYGVASTVLGGAIQQDGPEKGLHERASQPEICSYYLRVLDAMITSGRVEFLGNSEYRDGTVFSRLSGERFNVAPSCRIVDARYLSPSIPAETAPPFGVNPGARVVPVNDLVHLEDPPGQYVIAGSGKTATDAIIWLLSRGVGPDDITWVRPRDPWMLNRAVVQPNPAIFQCMAADVLEAGAAAASLDDFFLRLEDAGVMLRIDRTVLPTMAKAPTLATWELERLRSIENVVRRGHIESVSPGTLIFADGPVSIPRDAVVVHCAADGLKQPPLVPVWQPDLITLQPIRAGFPCFGAALIGYVEATRDDGETKNRLCPPTPYGNTLADWARMTVLGSRASRSFTAEPDIKAWSDQVMINPSGIPPDQPRTAALDRAVQRLGAAGGPGLARLAELAGLAS
ncbi:FAD/NAD(P)-binding protein [Microlunatus sp. Gsoil 973]|uniref:NAD(P)-binding protein n=1 Tax=Microlunatus sp. Gsoil 973 TaxID=2672569 RepID=UPI0012B501A2|nr:FAD/NAD(P)-binding protein [Microlunatus sp. Gsoil 973]QGN34822.1 NAD(P)-binding protein [Microlunatus sp. Gsoil 973]